jgi:hypothetical protein
MLACGAPRMCEEFHITVENCDAASTRRRPSDAIVVGRPALTTH